MPYKDKDKRKEYAKQYGSAWYKRNRERTLKRTREIKKQKRKEFQEYKAGLACFFCGFQHPAVIDFHHPEKSGEEKVSELVGKGCFKKAYQEAEKCIPLCANCHRIHHWIEREGELDFD